MLLGRDTFSSSGAIRVARPSTPRSRALEGFRQIMDGYGVSQVRAVATSAVREARNGDMFLDRIQRPHRDRLRDHQRSGGEPPAVYLAVRDALGQHAAFKGAWTLLVEVGGGSTSLTLLRRGEPNRSGVYALGAVRMRQQLDLRRHSHDVQVGAAQALHRQRHRGNPRRDPAAPRHAHHRDRRRRALRGVADPRRRDRRAARARFRASAFLAFCDEVERLDEDGLVERFRLPAVEAETLVPALLVYRTLLAETAARKRGRVRRVAARRRAARPGRRRAAGSSAEDFERQVLASAEALGQRTASTASTAATSRSSPTRLFDELRDEHGLGDRERLLLQVAALLHDIGIYVSLRAHHKHSQYLLAASQIFGLSDDDTAIVVEHRALPPPRPAAEEPPAVHRARSRRIG